MIDSKKRSVSKAVSWKILGIIILGFLAYSSGRSLGESTILALFYHAIMLMVYFLHERAWNMVSWGKTKGLFIQMTGLSGAGKTTLSRFVADRLKSKGIQVELIDGDEYRTNLCSDLGFSKEDRNTNIRRLGFVASVLARNRVVTIISAINPYEEVRDELATNYGDSKLVYVKAKLDTVVDRDVKGLYAKALLPEGDPHRINNFTGISDPFEEPKSSDLVIKTDEESLEISAEKLENFILEHIQ